MSFLRIRGLILRHLYLFRRSFPRILEIIYWPLFDLLVWGFLSVYLARFQEALPNFVLFFIGALILWDILFRSQAGISVSFLEDVWSKNLLNLFASPIKTGDYLVALMAVSFLKLSFTSVLLSLLAWLIYSFNIFVLGLSLFPIFANLVVFGWIIGIVTTALILRFGQEAEVLAWALGILFMPVSAVFYPVEVLPRFLQAVAHWVPSSHVFEGMRAVLGAEGFPLYHLFWAVGLNAAYLLCAFVFFNWNFRVVKRKGLLVRIGE
jgi:ABC-2 type transport system permease protein